MSKYNGYLNKLCADPSKAGGGKKKARRGREKEKEKKC